MRPLSAVLCLCAGLLLAGCAVGGGTTTTTTTVTRMRTVTIQAQPAPGTETSHAQYFGTIDSISEVDAKRYLVVFKPEYFLVGVTANVIGAAREGTTCEPLDCPGVDNDHVVIPAGTQKLTFVLPAKVNGTVVTLGTGVDNTPVTAADLASIVGGASGPAGMEPLESGIWLTIDGDTVTSFEQAYQP